MCTAHQCRSSSRKNRVIKPATGEPEAGRNIFRFEIGQLFEDLLLGEPCGKKIQHVDHPNSHITDARPPSTLRRINGDSSDEFSHDEHP